MSNQTNTAAHERVTPRTGYDTTALMTGAETWFSTMTEYQRGVGQFISDRLAKDAEAIRQALSCRDWTAALEVQGRWVDETLRDYSEEITKLTGLYTKTTAPTIRERHRA